MGTSSKENNITEEEEKTSVTDEDIENFRKQLEELYEKDETIRRAMQALRELGD